jgi:hypothetical protein
MGRVFDASILTNRAVIETAVLVVLTLAAVLILHNLHHVSAANTGSGTNLSAQNTTSSSTSNQSSVQPEGSSDSGQATNSNHTRITVNGQDIQVPQNGSVNQTMTDGNTTTTVNAQSSSSSSDSQGQATNSNKSSVNVQVNSHSSNQGGSL